MGKASKLFIANVIELTPDQEMLPRPEMLKVLSLKLTGTEDAVVDDDLLSIGRHPKKDDHWIVACNIRVRQEAVA